MLWSYEVRNADEKTLLNDLFERLAIQNPIVITDMHLRIVGVNVSWVNMCKFSHEDAFGETPRILQGPLTNVESARSFTSTLAGGSSTFASLINYKKDGSVFVNHIHGWGMGDLFVAETYKEEVLEISLGNTTISSAATPGA